MSKAKTNTSVQSVATACETVDISSADHTFANVVRALYVGGSGDVIIRGAGDDADVTFKNVPAGTILLVAAAVVRRTNTTAAFMVGLI